MTKLKTIRMTAGTLDPRGTGYTAEALQGLADRFPEKLSYADGELSSLVEFEDDQQRSQLVSSIQYHLEQRSTQQASSDLFERCSERQVEPLERGFRLHCMHPQWGGYGGCAEVEFSQYSGDSDNGPGCFELAVYHDGDFCSDEIEFRRHCCSADQFIRFGLDVLEAQMQHQLGLDENPVRLSMGDQTQLEEYQERIQRLLDG